MRVVALLAIRNEELYLSRCLEHLFNQGIETCVMDNGSTDRSLEIANSYQDKGVFRIERIPFNGEYDWCKILRKKEQLACEIEADWFIHHDADEIREAPLPYETLVEGIADVDRQGYNAINFNEFVFLPTNNNESYEGTDYVETMRYYYYLLAKPLFRVNAWKKTGVSVNLTDSGGHIAEFEGRKIYPESFFLRHYILLSKAHAMEKYGKRVFAKKELEKGWHGMRAFFSEDKLNFPRRKRLKKVTNDKVWDKSDPWKAHEFFGDSGSERRPLRRLIKAIYRFTTSYFAF